MEGAGHLEMVASSLYKYRKDKFLCDLVFLIGDTEEVYAHSNVVAASSVKLRAAFEQCDVAKGNSLFRLSLTDASVITVELILLYIYTGSLSNLMADTFDVSEVISTGQKLGMDPNLLTECVSALLALADAGYLLESLPAVVLSDEDLCLEVVDKATAFKIGVQNVSPIEVIRVASAAHSVEQISATLESSGSNLVVMSTKTTTGNENCTGETSDPLVMDSVTCSDNIKPKLEEQNLEVTSSTGTVSKKIKQKRSVTKRKCKTSTAKLQGSVNSKQPSGSKTRRVCEFCGRSYKTMKEYVEHSRTHSGDKPFKCDLCGKAFARKSSYDAHTEHHSGKVLQCDLCGKRYSSSRELRKHIRLHAGEVLYKCDICGRQFNHHGEFADHRRLHSGLNACPVCNKQFTRRHIMREHLNKMHSGQKKYECEVCGKVFSYSSGRRYHRRVHKEQRLQQCVICNRSFHRESELKRHNSTFHNLL